MAYQTFKNIALELKEKRRKIDLTRRREIDLMRKDEEMARRFLTDGHPVS